MQSLICVSSKEERKWERKEQMKKIATSIFRNVSQMNLTIPLIDVCNVISEKMTEKSALCCNILTSISTGHASNHEQYSNEIRKLVKKISLSKNRASRIAKIVTEDLKYVLNPDDSSLKLKVYGSYGNGLAEQSSDIDFSCSEGSCNVDLYNGVRSSSKQQKIRRIRELLFQCEDLLCESDEFEIECSLIEARIPLIKLIHVETNKKCDISFENIRAIRNTSLMKTLIQINPNIKTLVLYIKFLLKKYQLHGTNKITTYILFWLVVFFLQTKTGFYSIDELFQTGVIESYFSHSSYIVRRKNHDYTQLDFGKYLYVVFHEFLNFYANYNFAKFVICPYSGEEVDIKKFNDSKIPQTTFFKTTGNTKTASFPHYAMNIQDPTDYNFNLGKSMPYSEINKFQLFCSYLHELLPVPGKMLSKNDLLSTKFPSALPVDYDWKNFKCCCIYGTKYLMNDFSLATTGIRKMMEFIFEFKLVDPFVQNRWRKFVANRNELIKAKIPVAFFSYVAVKETRQNENFLKIFSILEDKNRRNTNLEVFIVCEENPVKQNIRFLVQSEDPFTDFLNRYARNMLNLIIVE